MKPQKLFYILLILWMFVDLLQAIFTPMHADEAYYALYGRFLDWGYYDHPPMVALLTAFSNILFNGNLSIRFATVLLHGATVLLLGISIEEKLTSNRAVITFFAISASIPVFIIYGFITTPDAPLLFFTALFFLLYKRYVKKPSWHLAIFLGIAVTAMLYSKYMAVLVVFFVILSNLRLLKDPKIIFAGFLALILFIPHILWQVNHDFQSLQYHLMQRNTSFKFQYALEYLPLQLLVFDPLCLILALYFCWKNHNTKDKFLRASGSTLVGFIIFFWIMTIKGHAEPHWTMAATVPMIFILFDELCNEKWVKLVHFALIPITALLLFLRLFAPLLGDEDFEILDGCPYFYNDICQNSEGDPVLFTGSFQTPSLYWFNKGNETTALSSVYNRRTQFDIWQFDRKYHGKPVCVLEQPNYHIPYPEEKTTVIRDCSNRAYNLLKINSFQGANRIDVDVDEYHLQNDSLYLKLTLHNTYDQPFIFAHSELPVTLFIAYKTENETHTIECPIPENIVIPAGESTPIATKVQYIPDAPFVICLDNLINRSINSKPIKIKAND